MILVGYPGVGKSSISNRMDGFVDLESSNFSINGSKDLGWVAPYINVAIDLHRQGYDVFVSSHFVVRNELKKRVRDGEIDNSDVLLIYPSIDLKEEWIGKLKKRYEEDHIDGHLRAYERSKNYYDTDINDMRADKDFANLLLDKMNYSLHIELQIIRSEFNIDRNKPILNNIKAEIKSISPTYHNFDWSITDLVPINVVLDIIDKYKYK